MRRFLLFVLFSLFLITPAYGEEITAQAGKSADIYAVENGLDSMERDITGKLYLDGSYDSGQALKRLIDSFLSSLKEELHSIVGIFSKISTVCFLCACCSALDGGGRADEYIGLAACCVISLMLVGETKSIGSQALDSMQQLNDYSKAALPAVFTSAAAGGMAVSAGAKYAASCFAMEVMMSLSRDIIIPMIYSYIALSVAAGIYNNEIIQTCISFTKWLATTLMTVMAIAFTSYLTLTGLIAGSTDAVAVKTARTLVSKALPVVGGLISDSASVVLAAANVIKTSAGVFSLIAVCALCLLPVVKLFVRLLMLRGAAALCQLIPGGNCTTLVKNISLAMGMMLGLIGCSAMIMFISIMSAIKTVTV